MTAPIAHQTKVEKPWGKEIILTPPALPYTGKILELKEGHRLSLQSHEQKQETLTLFSGEATLSIGSDPEALEEVKMETLKGYTISPGIVHRVTAQTNSLLLESSTSEKGTTKRIEDDYKRLDETPEERKKIHEQKQT